MATNDISRLYDRVEFVNLVGPIDKALFDTHIAGLVTTVPITRTAVTPDGGLEATWGGFPVAGDLTALDAKVASFVGGTTSRAPIEINAFPATTTQSNTHQTKIDQTTPALEAGTYQVLWCSSLRMLAVAANTGIEGKIRVTRSDGVFVEQPDAWDLANGHAFNGGLTFVVQAGQTIRVQLTFARLGASGTAEMSGARVTIDQLSAA